MKSLRLRQAKNRNSEKQRSLAELVTGSQRITSRRQTMQQPPNQKSKIRNHVYHGNQQVNGYSESYGEILHFLISNLIIITASAMDPEQT